MLKKIFNFLKTEIVLTVSLLLALISIILVPVSKDYLSYIDYRTLSLLLCMMLIMAGMQELQVFQQLGESLTARVSSVRGIALILILLCFFLSMLITNDVALLTFVPFTVVVLHVSGMDSYLIPLVVLETVAANLGSMLLPMGNPQNLYLYSLSGMGMGEFVLLMLPYSLLSLLVLLLLNLLLVKKEKLAPPEKHNFKRKNRDKARLAIYLGLFFVTLLVVVRCLDYRVGLILVLSLILLFDRRVFVKVDYSLLFTFVFLFIFIGNLKQIDFVRGLLESLVSGNEILVSILSSQAISNVPSAILLSGFTDNIKGLLVGTNLGGLGTLIASMASLISFKIYGLTQGADKGRYLILFSAINIGLLILLYGLSLIV